MITVSPLDNPAESSATHETILVENSMDSAVEENLPDAALSNQ
jgi:hypothetical protein